MTKKPVAVLIADVHYSLHTMELADASMRMAIAKANELDVPLVVAGDLHDTKALLRGECVNAMLKTFALAIRHPYVLPGNHCKLNEKSEGHSLNFLQTLAIIVDEPMDMPFTGSHGIPYHHDADALRRYLKTLPKGSRLIMHQGCQGSKSGDYIQDKSALAPEDVADFRVISGHYHTRQDFKCGPPRKGAVGLWSYIGNPYTMSFGEASDPPKGFQVLYDNGLLEFVPTNLRRHVVLEHNCMDGDMPSCSDLTAQDIVKVQIRGSRAALRKVSKDSIRAAIGFEGFRLDLIPTDEDVQVPTSAAATTDVLLDSVISTLAPEQAERIKALWRSL